MEKAVFQRNQYNQANLNIAGNYTTPITSVEAQLTNVVNNNIVISWTTISPNPTKGFFNGTLSNVIGGWYFLEIRGKLNGNVVANTQLSRVGVGEVFIIAGQSNAQGVEGDYAEVGAMDDRVLSHNENTLSAQCDLTYPNYPSFTQIFSNGTARSYLSKTAKNPWCYGKLGDNLVNKLGVPVVFYNAASTATTSKNWKESSDGLPTNNLFTQTQYCNTIGTPYSALKISLNYYSSMFGARAVLWHQGETDNNSLELTDGSTYTSSINYVINKSRSNLGSNIPWVISRVSVFDKNANGGLGNSNTAIIDAQNAVINSSNQIFSGPYTDDILGANRLDEVHFYGAGLIELANRWDAALSLDFFNYSIPIPAKSLPIITVSCHSNNEFRLSAPTGFAYYKWVRTDFGNDDFEDVAEATTQTLDRSTGTYRCYLTDIQGNITFTQPITVQNVPNTCLCTGIPSCSGVTYLSNNTPCSSINGYGPIEMDKSNGQDAAGDGTTIKLKGVSYAKGIGVHANSQIIYNLNNNFGRFITHIGIDDEVNDATEGTTVIFKVYKDNILSYTSAVLNKNSATIKLNIDVTNFNELKLEVYDAADNFFADHADWAGARLHCPDSQAPTAPTSLVESNVGQNCVTLTWAGSTDNMEVEKYNIYKDGNLIGSVDAPTTTLKVTGLLQLNYYEFTVRAVDFSGNESNASNILEVVTLQNPIIFTSKKIINIGQTSSLSAYGCTGGIVNWSNGSTANPLTVSPTDTTIYTVTCTVGNCVSIIAKDTVKVIPNCKLSYNLINNTINNFTGSSTNLTFSASQTIIARNLINSQATVNYKAANSITLLPGFQATIGTVFKAYIGGCLSSPILGSYIHLLDEPQPSEKPKVSHSLQKNE